MCIYVYVCRLAFFVLHLLFVFLISFFSEPNSREIDGEKAAGSNNVSNLTQEVGPKGSSSTSTSKTTRGPFAKSKSKDIASKSCGISSGQDLLGE